MNLAFHFLETEGVNIQIIGHDVDFPALDQQSGHGTDSIGRSSHGVRHDADMRRLSPSDEDALFYALHQMKLALVEFWGVIHRLGVSGIFRRIGRIGRIRFLSLVRCHDPVGLVGYHDLFSFA